MIKSQVRPRSEEFRANAARIASVVMSLNDIGGMSSSTPVISAAMVSKSWR